jgi:hypothetical protein
LEKVEKFFLRKFLFSGTRKTEERFLATLGMTTTHTKQKREEKERRARHAVPSREKPWRCEGN